ncbi:hypothetical protein EGW08_018492 [Elysia chlorotica]|uniref:PDZ domain-containing protein n=1 Tax=Elysia chlorotica TaxID=188477 RepID=A0A3S0Z9E8_ELYCH|nr:hypothetical protein EGW08_018492 [Elysia chlorotica]
MGSSDPPTFCVVCPDRVIELVAASRSQMLEWVSTVESCLVDLGVIKKEPVEHVYTVCPAVVRKPRVSKEVLEEREAEALMLAARAQVPSTPAPAVHSTPAPAVPSSPVPPVPSSPAPAIPSTPAPATPSVSQPSEHQASSPSSDTSPGLPGPGDRWATSTSADGAGGAETQPRVPPRTKRKEPGGSSTPSDTDMEVNDHRPPPLPSRPHLTATPSTSSLLTPMYPANSLTHPITESSNDSDFVSAEVIAQLRMKRADNLIPEGQHSPTAKASGGVPVSPTLPSITVPNVGKNGASASSPSGKSKELGKDSVPFSLRPREDGAEISSCSSSLSSPSPSPALEQMLGISNSGSNVSPQENEYSLLPSHSGACALPKNSSEITSTNSRPTPRPRHTFKKQERLQDEMHPSDLADFCNDSLSNSIYDNNFKVKASGLNDNENKDVVFGGAKFRKDRDKRKDENENCYGLIFEAPTTPCVPPLPPRHDSLLESPQSPSNLSKTSRQLALSDGEDAPPLPVPRRNTARARLGTAHRMSSPGVSDDLEIPPMPPRRRSPRPSQALSVDSQDEGRADADKPPALPSRPCQSFYIKRPQLTVQSQPQSESSPGGPGTVAQTNGVEAGSSQSGLARMMLLDRAHSLHTVVSLKQTQAEILQSEISMPSLALTLTQKSGHGLALVDWSGLPCVVGWNQRDFPSLHGKLHIGDQLISVNGVKVTSVDVAQKLLRGASTPKITLVLHRMPFARVFAIRRDAEGQSLGIKREGGSGEIVYVDPNGLAAQHGLTAYAAGALCEARCNWFITEINNRPISLFFKENEIEHRLSAVGREISIVVQPSDFVHEIRKQFKKIKNYKHFIAQ